MRPKDLFKPGLTVPEHEIRDLHYIGEALPVPSQIVSTLGGGIFPYTGDSPIPAREDHIHDIDETTLISVINENHEDIVLENYVTNTFLDENYYTITETNTQINNEIINIITDIDSLFIPFELFWSYGPIVNPASDVFLNRYSSFRSMNVTQIHVTASVADSLGEDIVCRWWVDVGAGFVNEETVTLTSGDTHEYFTLTVPFEVGPLDQMYFEIDAVTSDAELLTISVKGFYPQ